jgi:aspartate-semialdehyde dehydrogenase
VENKVKNDPVVAIAGVTGAVGAEFIATMDKRAFRVGKLKALASGRSAGKTVDFRGQKVMIEELGDSSFEGVDIALFSAGSGVARKFAPIAVKAGAVVIDNSSAFRMDPDVPLVIPEINARRIREHKGIIANPRQTDQARDPVDLPGGQWRRRGGDAGTDRVDARAPRRGAL